MTDTVAMYIKPPAVNGKIFAMQESENKFNILLL